MNMCFMYPTLYLTLKVVQDEECDYPIYPHYVMHMMTNDEYDEDHQEDREQDSEMKLS